MSSFGEAANAVAMHFNEATNTYVSKSVGQPLGEKSMRSWKIFAIWPSHADRCSRSWSSCSVKRRLLFARSTERILEMMAHRRRGKRQGKDTKIRINSYMSSEDTGWIGQSMLSS